MLKKKLTKLERQFFIRNLLFILGGTMLIALGTALFLTKLNIVSGGLSGIAIIIQYYMPVDFLGGQAIDFFAFILGWILWLLGLIFVGKEFAIKTLVSTIVYPLFLALFLRVPFFMDLTTSIGYYGLTEVQIEGIQAGTFSIPIGNLLICSIFAGVLVGSGVAFNFRGGGSSGGIDVIMAIVEKYFGVKESVTSFVADASIIACGAFLIPNNVIPSLCGVMTAFVTAWMIEYFYIGRQTSFQADIISDKWEEISKFVQDTLGRGATVIRVEGGYKGDDRVILRVVFDRTQFKAMREFIGKIDPKAFMTFTQTFGVYGEGFKPHKTKK